MRWEQLFEDIEAQMRAQESAELAGEIAERTRAERAGTGLAERLLAHHGAELTLVLGEGQVSGRVGDVAPQWVLLTDDRAAVVVPTAAVVAVRGLGRGVAVEPGAVLRRLGLGHVLRGLSRDRVPVAMHASGHRVSGTIDRVGADHLDLAVHPLDEPRRPGSVSEVVAVAFAHLHQVRTHRVR